MTPSETEDKKAARRGGRPSKKDAELIQDKILDAAAASFFTEGYGATSIESIARRAGISKRTFYHRFEDKAEVFRAVVQRVIERLRPPGVPLLFKGGSLEEILHKLARVIVRAALSPEAIALQRLILSEATRFPELAAIMNNQGARQEAVQLISGLLQHEGDAQQLSVGNTSFAAEQFLQMIVGVPQRRALGLGAAMSNEELNAWARDTVTLFLNGWRHASVEA